MKESSKLLLITAVSLTIAAYSVLHTSTSTDYYAFFCILGGFSCCVGMASITIWLPISLLENDGNTKQP